MKVVVILPTFNERENIPPLFLGLRQAANRIKKHHFSFVVVDDNSPDGTAEEVKNSQGKYSDVFILHSQKQGLGKALLRGMTFAVNNLRADIIVQMDADLSHDPLALPKFLEAIDRGADFAIGSRYIPGGSIPDNWGVHRKIFSRVGNAVVRFGLGYTEVHDWTGGYRAFKSKYYGLIRDGVSAYSGYVFQIAFLHQAIKHRATVFEVPIKFIDRRYGRSKIAPSEYIRNVLEYVFKARMADPLAGSFSKFLVVGTIGFIINTLILELAVYLGLHPAVGSATGAELAIVSNFILNNSWTFRSRRVTSRNVFKKFIQFNTTSLGAILIQSGTVALGTFVFGVAVYRIFYIFGVGLGLIWNYTMYSRVIWKPT